MIVCTYMQCPVRSTVLSCCLLLSLLKRIPISFQPPLLYVRTYVCTTVRSKLLESLSSFSYFCSSINERAYCPRYIIVFRTGVVRSFARSVSPFPPPPPPHARCMPACLPACLPDILLMYLSIVERGQQQTDYREQQHAVTGTAQERLNPARSVRSFAHLFVQRPSGFSFHRFIKEYSLARSLPRCLFQFPFDRPPTVLLYLL